MTPNQQTVERYMEGFRRTDREMVLSCLTDPELACHLMSCLQCPGSADRCG
jgi:hypothetical protein